jgi:hypothetical protein
MCSRLARNKLSQPFFAIVRAARFTSSLGFLPAIASSISDCPPIRFDPFLAALFATAGALPLSAMLGRKASIRLTTFGRSEISFAARLVGRASSDQIDDRFFVVIYKFRRVEITLR